MSAVVEVFSNAVSDVVDFVGDVVEDVGDFVVDKIVEPVAETVEKTIDSALEDPVGTIAKVAAVASGQVHLLPYISAASTIAQGGDLDDALKSAAVSYVAGEAGSLAGEYAALETGSPFMATTAGGLAGGATGAALTGGDILSGAIAGGLNAATKYGTGQAAQHISDEMFENWSQEQGAIADESRIWPTEQDVLAADPSISMDFPLTTPTTETGPGFYNEETGAFVPSDIGGLQAPLTEASGTNLSSMDGYGYDPSTQVWTTPDNQTVDLGYLETSSQPVSGSDILEPPSEPVPAAYEADLSKSQIQSGLSAGLSALLNQDEQDRLARRNALKFGMGGADTGIPWLDTSAQMLKGQPIVDDASVEPPPVVQSQQPIGGIVPELAGVLGERGYQLPQQPMPLGYLTVADGGSIHGYATGSTVTCSPFDMGQYLPKFYASKDTMLAPSGGRRAPLTLAQLKQMQSHISPAGNIGGMAKGGLPSKYEEARPDGHNPEFITGLTGYYAGGRGTGQSDDIDAMLHDGDYVMDAEAVSALGDGSSKAGNEVLMQFMKQVPHRMSEGGKPVPAKIADGEVVLPESFVTALGNGDNKRGAKMLDEMRQRLREHKRSAPNSKIPPKAKSPLEYLRGAKG